MRRFEMPVLFVIGWLCVSGAALVMAYGLGSSVAWADDDGGDADSDSDSDSDDGDDDDDGTGAGVGGAMDGPHGRSDRQPGRRGSRGPGTQRSPAPQPIARPDFASGEIVARGLTEDAAALLVTQGYVVLERADLAVLGTTIRRFGVPDGVSLQQARDTIRALPNGETADFNHFYRSEQDDRAIPDLPRGMSACEGLHCPARGLIGWPAGLPASGCGAPVTLGIVDTGLNIDHEVLVGADIDLIRLAPEDYSASDASHGTAVAALLVGAPQSRVPGLLPGLPLVAVDAFHKRAGDERADAFTLVRALDHLAESGAQVINLSLAGPPNAVLEETLLRLTQDRRVPVIAAVGNNGPGAGPAYPAAYDSVIAVTAVDCGGAVYRRAIRGPQVDLAAPGVKVWTAASQKGANWKTGTSFAAPYVTAAVALWLQQDPRLAPKDILARLAASAQDLGTEGFDDAYGHGMLDLGGACPGAAVLRPVSAQ